MPTQNTDPFEWHLADKQLADLNAKMFDVATEPIPEPTPITLEDGLTNFEVIELALNRIYDLADCDGADTISLMIQVASDHLGIIRQKIENKDAEAAKRALKANQEHERLQKRLDDAELLIAGMGRILTDDQIMEMTDAKLTDAYLRWHGYDPDKVAADTQATVNEALRKAFGGE